MEERGDAEAKQAGADRLSKAVQFPKADGARGSAVDDDRALGAADEQQQIQDQPRDTQIDGVLEKHVVHGLPRRPPHVVEGQAVHADPGPDDWVGAHELQRGDRVPPPLLGGPGRVRVDTGDRAQAVHIGRRQQRRGRERDHEHDHPAPSSAPGPRPGVGREDRRQRQETAARERENDREDIQAEDRKQPRTNDGVPVDRQERDRERENQVDQQGEIIRIARHRRDEPDDPTATQVP